MKKKLLMGLVLLIAVGRSAVFAQRAGETLQVGGQTYRVESNSNGRLVLQLVPSLDGVWVTGFCEIAISGSTATVTYINTNSIGPLTRDAMNKGYFKVGTQYLRNIRSTGNLKWSGENLCPTFYPNNPNVAIGTNWYNFTFTMSPDGQTINSSAGGVFTRDPGPRQY